MRLTQDEREEYLKYVQQYLLLNDGDRSKDEHQQFRSRILHTRRVLKWSELLREGCEVDETLLELGIIFHDVGYEKNDKSGHSQRGVEIFSEFAKTHSFSEEVIKSVEQMILLHGDKKSLNTHMPMELILLMESDLMDEEGAMLIAWDCMVAGHRNARSFEDAYRQIQRFYTVVDNPMITPRAKAFWEEKQKLRKEFIRQFGRDLFLEDQN